MNHHRLEDVELIRVIVNYGLGSKVIKTAKKYGATGGTIALGKGTVNNRLLGFIGLADMRKEIIYLIAERKTAIHMLEKLDDEYEFYKPNHGIAFTTSIGCVIGKQSISCDNLIHTKGDEESMYHLITTIVDRGKAEEVMNAATSAGAKGGTIMNARGSGIHETAKLFAMEIEPEKEIVIILTEAHMTDNIVTSIREKLGIDEPGKGIIFIQHVNETYGLRK